MSRKNGNTIALCDWLSRAAEAEFDHTTYKALKNPGLNEWPDFDQTHPIHCAEFEKIAGEYLEQNPLPEQVMNVSFINIYDYSTNDDEGYESSPSNEDDAYSTDEVDRINHVALTEACMNLESFRSIQREDPFICTIIDGIQERDPKYKDYYLKKGVLMVNDGTYQRLYVPESLKYALIQHYHGGLAGSHMGAKKLYRLLGRLYYWIGMEQNIREFIQQCKLCQFAQVYPKGRIAQGETHTPSAPNQLIFIDCITGLPRSDKGHTTILTIVDAFSKYCKAIPMKSKSSTECASAIRDHWITTFGTPKQIHSDEGETDSKLMFNLCSILGIRKSHTPVYHPESNGACEAMNKTIGTMLKTLIDDSARRKWAEQLPFMVAAYNSIPHTATGFSPNEILFGRDLSHQIVPLVPDEHETVTQSQYLTKLREGQGIYWQLVHAALAAQKRKRLDKEPNRQNPYKVGDFVLLKDLRPKVAKTAAQRGTKNAPRYIGPYRVVKSDSHTLHIVYWSNDSGLDHDKLPVHHQGHVMRPQVQVVHPDQCKPYHGPLRREPVLNRQDIGKFLRSLGIQVPDEEISLTIEPDIDEYSRSKAVPDKATMDALYDDDDDDDDVPSSTPFGPHPKSPATTSSGTSDSGDESSDDVTSHPHIQFSRRKIPSGYQAPSIMDWSDITRNSEFRTAHGETLDAIAEETEPSTDVSMRDRSILRRTPRDKTRRSFMEVDDSHVSRSTGAIPKTPYRHLDHDSMSDAEIEEIMAKNNRLLPDPRLFGPVGNRHHDRDDALPLITKSAGNSPTTNVRINPEDVDVTMQSLHDASFRDYPMEPLLEQISTPIVSKQIPLKIPLSSIQKPAYQADRQSDSELDYPPSKRLNNLLTPIQMRTKGKRFGPLRPSRLSLPQTGSQRWKDSPITTPGMTSPTILLPDSTLDFSSPSPELRRSRFVHTGGKDRRRRRQERFRNSPLPPPSRDDSSDSDDPLATPVFKKPGI